MDDNVKSHPGFVLKFYFCIITVANKYIFR